MTGRRGAMGSGIWGIITNITPPIIVKHFFVVKSVAAIERIYGQNATSINRLAVENHCQFSGQCRIRCDGKTIHFNTISIFAVYNVFQIIFIMNIFGRITKGSKSRATFCSIIINSSS